MINTAANQSPFGETAGEKDGPSDEDPGPSFLTVIIEADGWSVFGDVRTVINRAYLAALAALPELNGREVCIVLSDDASARALNARFRGLDKPTNVLSFPSALATARGGTAGAAPPLGDIIIALETVEREAAEERKPPLFHLAHLAVHGLLHLAGFTHETDAEAARMEALERGILSAMGIPDPYAIYPEKEPALAGERQWQ